MSSFLSGSFQTPAPSSQDKTATPSISFSAPFVSSLTSTLGLQLDSAPTSSSVVGGGGSVNKNGKVVFLINDVDSICSGTIGTSGKICCKLETECNTAKHKSQKHEKIRPGYYVKVSDSEIITSNFVPSKMVDPSIEHTLLSTEFKPKQLNAIMQVLNNQEQPGELDAKGLTKALKGIAEGTVLQTPAVKRRKVETLGNKYNSILSSLEETLQPSSMIDNDDVTIMANIKDFCDFTVQSLMKDEEAICGIGQQLEFVRTTLGNAQDESNYPNVWSGIIDIKSKVEGINETLTDKIDRTVMLKEISNSTQPIKSDLAVLNSNAQTAFSAVESKIMQLEQVMNKPVGPSNLFQSSLTNTFETTTKQELTVLHDQVTSLKATIDGFNPTAPNDTKETLVIGQYTFTSMQELAAWSELHLPASLPFGSFVDVYSYLERVNSFKDVASTTVLKNMEIRKKLELTADEALIIESFKHALPRIFNGGSSAAATSTSAWLPGVPTKDKWEDNLGLSGAKITLRDNETTIRTRVEEVISQRLQGHQEAQSLARVLLSDTIAFVGCLNRFISETYKRLDESGFGKVDSWKLVSKLVHRIFATDCHQRRGAVSEFLDASDGRTLSLGVLWGTFATHQIMREYMQHGIENHPSISSEYVRFLVANCGLERINKLEAQNDKLSTEVVELKKLVASQTKTLSTLANKTEEALKLAKKRPRQDQN